MTLPGPLSNPPTPSTEGPHPMTSTPRADAVHEAMQSAINLIEATLDGRRLDLDVDHLAELALVTSALVHLAASLVRSFDRPHADMIEGLRMLALEATTGEE